MSGQGKEDLGVGAVFAAELVPVALKDRYFMLVKGGKGLYELFTEEWARFDWKCVSTQYLSAGQR